MNIVRIALVLAVVIVVPAVSSAQAQTGTQTLQLLSWQSSSQAATWQKRDWKGTRDWCRDRTMGHERWRHVLKDAKCGTTVATAPLAAGQRYRVTVAGLYSHWRGMWRGECGTPIRTWDPLRSAWFNASASAKWAFAVSRPKGQCGQASFPSPGSEFRINNDPAGAPAGWKHPFPSTGAPNDTHSYAFDLVGAGGPLRLAIRDHWVVDNYGALAITIAPRA